MFQNYILILFLMASATILGAEMTSQMETSVVYELSLPEKLLKSLTGEDYKNTITKEKIRTLCKTPQEYNAALVATALIAEMYAGLPLLARENNRARHISKLILHDTIAAALINYTYAKNKWCWGSDSEGLFNNARNIFTEIARKSNSITHRMIANNRLGIMYKDGDGVVKDTKKAMEYFYKTLEYAKNSNYDRWEYALASLGLSLILEREYPDRIQEAIQLREVFEKQQELGQASGNIYLERIRQFFN